MSSPDVHQLKVVAEFDRSLIWYQGNSVRYLGVSVIAPAVVIATTHPRLPLNLAVVIDASGSMSGGKLEAAKQAAAGLVERLGPADVLSVVSFATQVVTHSEPLPLDEGNKRAALEAIASLHPRDNTNLSGGWLRGAECVGGYLEAHAGCRNRILLLSDGHANQGIMDPHELGCCAEVLCGRGIHSSAVGIGSDYSSAQLEAIAINGGGQLHRATTPAEIVQVVLGELEDVATTVAENITVDVSYPAGVQVEPLGDFPVTHTPQQVSCQLGALIAAGTRLAIFKVKAPAGAVSAELAFTTRVRWSPPGSREVLAAAVAPALLRFAHDAANDTQPRHPLLSMEVARVWQGAVLRRAVRLNREGRFSEARHLLETEFQFFQRYCRELPQAAPLVEEMTTALADIAHTWDEGRRKEAEIRYWKQTRQERDHRRQQ